MNHCILEHPQQGRLGTQLPCYRQSPGHKILGLGAYTPEPLAAPPRHLAITAIQYVGARPSPSVAMPMIKLASTTTGFRPILSARSPQMYQPLLGRHQTAESLSALDSLILDV